MSSGNGNYRVLGTRPRRHDGAEKVTGSAIYGNDVQLPGVLTGFVLRSPHPHARIRSIDTSEAEATEGVFAVISGKDFPEVEDKVADLGEGSVNLSYLSGNVMAKDKVLYKGHAVAAVAAISPHIAEEALDLIEVDAGRLAQVQLHALVAAGGDEGEEFPYLLLAAEGFQLIDDHVAVANHIFYPQVVILQVSKAALRASIGSALGTNSCPT